jgi:hypothetical protein
MSDGFFTSAIPDDDYQPPDIDTSVAHQARVYDYWLGGKDNFAADREVGDKAMQAYPDLPVASRANRAFLGRAVRFLAGEAGIRHMSCQPTPPSAGSGDGRAVVSRFRGRPFLLQLGANSC